LRFLALAFAFAAAVANAALSETEREIAGRVSARSEEAIALLERTVRINSGTLNTEGVREVGAIFRAELDALGFKTRWVEMPEAMQRAGHLVATREGSRGKRILLIGHLDTVFEKHSPVQLWERQGHRVKGQGVLDMKGGDVAIVEALRALHGLGLLDDTTITVVLVGDEERLGSPVTASRRELLAAARASDVALDFEGMARLRGGVDLATIERRGSGGVFIEVTAKPGHSSAVFAPQGASLGAIYEGARVLNAIREQVAEPGLSFSPGVALGGTVVDYDRAQSSGTAFGKSNVIPRSFVSNLDMRYVDLEQRERAQQKIREIAAASLPGTHTEVRFTGGYPPMPATAGNRALLETYSRVSEDAGLGPVRADVALERGASDISFVAPYVDAMDGLGPIGGGSHSVDEWLDLPSLERSAVRAALVIYRLTRDPRPGNDPR